MEENVNSAIIGNSNITCLIDSFGNYQKIYFPSVDFKSQFDSLRYFLAVYQEDNLIEILDLNNLKETKKDNVTYFQNFLENSNVCQSIIDLKDRLLNIKQYDFVNFGQSDKNILTRKFEIENNNDYTISVRLFVQAVKTGNKCGTYLNQEGLVMFNHDFSCSLFAKRALEYYKVDDKDLEKIPDNIALYFDSYKDKYEAVSNASCIGFEKVTIAAGHKGHITSYIAFFENSKANFNDIEFEAIRIKKKNSDDLLNQNVRYFQKYLRGFHIDYVQKLPLKWQKIYISSLILLEVLKNDKTGALVSEFCEDEQNNYVWIRNMYFVQRVWNLLKKKDENFKYITTFLPLAQKRDGSFEQRYYTNGNIAPSWGYQIDQSALAICSIYEYYDTFKDPKVFKATEKLVDSSLKYMKKYVATKYGIIEKEKEEFNKKDPARVFQNAKSSKIDFMNFETYDVWETINKDTIFSVASIFYYFVCIEKIYEVKMALFKDQRLKYEKLAKEKKEIKYILIDLKKYIVDNYYSKELEAFVRCVDGNMDNIDISALSLIYPFNVLTKDEKLIQNTVFNIQMNLKTYTNGYVKNKMQDLKYPDTTSTLLMAQYYLAQDQKEIVEQILKLIVATSNNNGYIASEIDNELVQGKGAYGNILPTSLFIELIHKMNKKGYFDIEQ